MVIRSGILRQVVTFERLADTQQLDEDGNVVQQWETVPFANRVPCSIRDVGSRAGEIERGRSIESIATHEIKLRHLDGLSTDMRIRELATSRRFEIDRIADVDGMRRDLVIRAREQNG